MKNLFLIYANTKSLFEKIGACDNNTEESFTEKTGKYLFSCYSLLTNYSLDSSKGKHYFYRNSNFTEKFYANLKKHAKQTNKQKNKKTKKQKNYEEYVTLSFVDKKNESYSNQKFCHI